MLGSVIVSCIMPWRSSFPCHRMCCGPDTLLWFALSVFRVADMIGIVGHVSFLPQKRRKNNKTSSSQMTGEAHGSLHHSWATSGSASGCWSSHCCGKHTALLGRGRIAR